MPSNAVCPSIEMRAHTCSPVFKVIDTGPSLTEASSTGAVADNAPIVLGTLLRSSGTGDWPVEVNAEITRIAPSTNNTTAPIISNHVGMPPPGEADEVGLLGFNVSVGS